MSRETICRSLFIQARGVLKKELMDHLRSKRRMRRSRHGSEHGQYLHHVHNEAYAWVSMAFMGRAVERISTLRMTEREDLLHNLASTYGPGGIDLLGQESLGLAVLVTVRDEFGGEMISRDDKS